MTYNYHTHTYRCSHAVGTEEEYILRAIEGGIKHMGFSDHMPFVFPDGYESYYRIPFVAAGDYISVISSLREKYKSRIEIKIGFEMEYYPIYFGEMLKNAKKLGAEYLILGQHFLQNEHPGGVYSGEKTESAVRLKEYVDCIISAMNTGVFTYVAHPDLINFVGNNELYKEQMRRICIASKELNIPLEINFLGIREGRNYPNYDFWQLAGEEKSPVTYGFDAHSTKTAYDAESLEIADKIKESFCLNYIGKPELKLLTI